MAPSTNLSLIALRVYSSIDRESCRWQVGGFGGMLASVQGPIHTVRCCKALYTLLDLQHLSPLLHIPANMLSACCCQAECRFTGQAHSAVLVQLSTVLSTRYAVPAKAHSGPTGKAWKDTADFSSSDKQSSGQMSCRVCPLSTSKSTLHRPRTQGLFAVEHLDT